MPFKRRVVVSLVSQWMFIPRLPPPFAASIDLAHARLGPAPRFTSRISALMPFPHIRAREESGEQERAGQMAMSRRAMAMPMKEWEWNDRQHTHTYTHTHCTPAHTSNCTLPTR